MPKLCILIESGSRFPNFGNRHPHFIKNLHLRFAFPRSFLNDYPEALRGIIGKVRPCQNLHLHFTQVASAGTYPLLPKQDCPGVYVEVKPQQIATLWRFDTQQTLNRSCRAKHWIFNKLGFFKNPKKLTIPHRLAINLAFVLYFVFSR